MRRRLALVSVLSIVAMIIGFCTMTAAQITITLPGQEAAPSGAGNALDFGTVPVGQTAQASYTYKLLETSATSAIVTITPPTAPFGIKNLPSYSVTLVPGQSITFTVTYTPTTVGTHTGSFTITASGGIPVQVKKTTVTLTGQGIIRPEDTYPPPISSEEPSVTLPGPTTTPTPDLTEDVAKIETKIDTVETVLDELRLKLDNLAEVLGEWIVGRGQPFFIEPGTTGYNPTAPTIGIKGEIEDLERQLDELVAQLEEEVATEGVLSLPEVEVTPNSGDRFRMFLDLANQLLTETNEDLMQLNPIDAYTQAIVDSFSTYVLAARPEIEQLRALSYQFPQEGQAYLDYVVVDGAPELLYQINTGTSSAAKYNLAAKEKGNSLVSQILKKAGDIAHAIGCFFGPIGEGIGKTIKLITDDISKLLESNKDMIVLLSGLYMSELEQELKLEALINGLFDVKLDMSKGTLAEKEALEGVEPFNLPRRMGELEGKVEELERKITELGNTLKTKLDNLARGLGTTLRSEPYWIEPDDEQVSDTIDWRRSGVINQIELLRKKLDNLARILGEALYGKGFNIEPQAIVTSPVGEPEYDPIKPEIKNLESEVKVIKEKLEEILERIRVVPQPTPRWRFPPVIEEPTPPTTQTPPQVPESYYYEYVIEQLYFTKKIYVYEEDRFVATSATDLVEVSVKTEAFDLAGWIDLTELRNGDEVTIIVEVSVADGPLRTWSTTVFSGVQARGLKFFTEFADGLEQVVGTDVKITIAQTASADGYATAVPIYYQFVVESQD